MWNNNQPTCPCLFFFCFVYNWLGTFNWILFLYNVLKKIHWNRFELLFSLSISRCERNLCMNNEHFFTYQLIVFFLVHPTVSTVNWIFFNLWFVCFFFSLPWRGWIYFRGYDSTFKWLKQIRKTLKVHVKWWKPEENADNNFEYFINILLHLREREYVFVNVIKGR